MFVANGAILEDLNFLFGGICDAGSCPSEAKSVRFIAVITVQII
jgi:hypothetical protein